MIIFSPLEQFRILPFWTLTIGSFSLSITKALIILCIGLGSFAFIVHSVFGPKQNLIPTPWHVLLNTIYATIGDLIYESLGKRGEAYFPLLFSLFCFILVTNLIGLVPYSFTMTSHLIVTLTLSLSLFIGINYIGIEEKGSKMFSLFLPGGTSLGLSLLLVPIELVSYIFKPISLGVRLFANMMAGHTLLKVIAGFAWSMLGQGKFLFVAHFIPLLVLVALMGLELGVSLIQTYVFTILTCIYLADVLNDPH